MRPAEAETFTMVANVEFFFFFFFFVNKDHSGIAGGSYSVLHRWSIGTSDYTRKKLGMSKVSARWVPKQLKQLTEDKKKKTKIRFWTVLSLGMKCGFITLTLKAKAQSKQWKLTGSPPPKKFKLSPSAGKVMLVACRDSCEITLAHFMPKGRNMAATYYSEILKKKKKKKSKKKKSKKKKMKKKKRIIFCMTMTTLSYCLIYRSTYQQHLQEATVVPPSVQPRPWPLNP